jgi:ABC-type phosphate/phosphonate transport system substrate-binding protein
MHNPGMIRKSAIAAALFLSCTLASAAPPLRLAVPAGSQGLTAARLWTAIAAEFGNPDGTSLQPVIVQDDATALGLLRLRQVELAVLDPLSYLYNADEYDLLGLIEPYGKPAEAFVLIASMDSIIHRTADLWRAKLMLAGPRTTLPWAYPLAWIRDSVGFPEHLPEPLEADSYAGLLKGIALGTAEAGFLPEGFFLSIADGVLAARVRVIDRTEAFPLIVLVGRTDLGEDRKKLAKHLHGLAVEGLEISAADAQTGQRLKYLKTVMAGVESFIVPQP